MFYKVCPKSDVSESIEKKKHQLNQSTYYKVKIGSLYVDIAPSEIFEVCTRDENEFHIKTCPDSSHGHKRSERPRVRKMASPSTDLNWSERAATYSQITIKSLTLLFRQIL